MGYTNVLSFELNGVQIKTTVTNEVKVIDEHISSFLHPTANHQTKVIGFDTEWPPIRSFDLKLNHEINYTTKLPSFQLCDGNSCLIIIHSLDKVSDSLLNFLRQPNYIFVGCGIKDDFVKLEKHHGIGCKNAVEVGTLAATLMNEPHLRFCGIDELAFIVDELDLCKCRSLSFGNWIIPTINVYSYHKIGSALLAKYRPKSHPPVRCICLI